MPRQRRGAASFAHPPHDHDSKRCRDRTGQVVASDPRPLGHARGGKERWRAKGEDGEQPTRPRVPSFFLIGWVFSSSPWLFPLLNFSTNATSECETHGWRDPCASPCCRSPGEVLSCLQRLQIFQCYVIAKMILLLFRERKQGVTESRNG